MVQLTAGKRQRVAFKVVVEDIGRYLPNSSSRRRFDGWAFSWTLVQCWDWADLCYAVRYRIWPCGPGRRNFIAGSHRSLQETALSSEL